jgi:hypothetical protein
MNATDEEDEDHFEDFKEKVQGHFANQGKPPLDAYIDLIISLLHYYQFYNLHGLLFM